MECGSICRSAIQCLPSNLEAWLLFSRTGEGGGGGTHTFPFPQHAFYSNYCVKSQQGRNCPFPFRQLHNFYGVCLIML